VHKSRAVTRQDLRENIPDEVALKLYRQQPYHDREFLARFEQEGAIGKMLRHPGIIRFYESGADWLNGTNIPFHALELGRENLGQFLNRRKNGGKSVSPEEALIIGEQLARAIDFCHESGVILRDLKPTNILLCGGDLNIKIADFDNAWMLGGPGVADRVGVTAFAAPEHFPDANLTTRTYACPESDIFAFGKILYLLLSNDYPRGIDARPIVELPSFLWSQPWAEDLCAILHKATTNEPLLRYHSARELIRDVREVCTSTPAVINEDLNLKANVVVIPDRRRRRLRRRLAFGAVLTAVSAIILFAGVVIKRQASVADVPVLSKPCSQPGKLINLRIVSTTGVNLRVGPSPRDRVVCTMNPGTTALLLGETKKHWSKIRILSSSGESNCESGMEGYSYGEFFKIDGCG